MVSLQACLPGLAAVIGVALCVWPGPATAQSGPPGWHVMRADAVSVAYPAGEEAAARMALQAAVYAGPRLAEDLGAKLPGSLRVDLCATHQQLEARLGRRQSLWVLGVAVPEQHRIVVKALAPQRLRRLVVHELTHMYLRAKLGESAAEAPQWLHEGVAMYYEGPLQFAERLLLSDAAATGRLHSISELERFPRDPAELGLAYAESYALVAFLCALAPRKGLGDFLDELKRSGSTERAALRTWGRSLDELEVAWHASIGEQYSTPAHPWNLQNALFALMALLAVIGWVRRRRRAGLAVHAAIEAEQREQAFRVALGRFDHAQRKQAQGRPLGDPERSGGAAVTQVPGGSGPTPPGNER